MSHRQPTRISGHPETAANATTDTEAPGVGTPGSIGRRRFLGGAAYSALGASAWLLIGCSGDDDAPAASPTSATVATATPEQPKRGGTLHMGQGADLSLAGGHPFALISQNRILAYAAHETLIQYKGNLTPSPVLAERFEVSPDFTRAVATLKQGVVFHNGAPLTTDDVAFSIQTLQDPTSAGLPATAPLELSAFAKAITVKVTNAQTIEFTFDRPRPNLADFFAQLHIAQRATFSDIAKGKVVGTGPFQLMPFTPGQGYRLQRFANWHGAGTSGAPYLDAIEVSLFGDQSTVVPSLRAGQLDAYLAVSAPNALPLQGTPQVRLAGKTGVNYLGVNVTNPMLQDPRVRSAIFYALDRAQIAKTAGQGFGTVTTQPWHPSSPAFDPAREASLFAPQKAATLLATSGFQQTRNLVIEYAAGSALQELQAQLIQATLGTLKVKIDILAVDPTQYTLRYRTGAFPDFWLASHLAGDLTPLTMFQQTFEYRLTGNISGFTDSTYSSLVGQLDSVAPDSAQAKAAYKGINQIMLDNPFVIPTGVPGVRIDVVAEKVAGWPKDASEYGIAPTGKVDFANVWLR